MYRISPKRWDSLRIWLLIGLAIAVLAVGGVWTLRSWYSLNLRPLSSSTTTTKYFSVETGTGLHEIATNLHKNKLIRSTRAFETYVRSNELHDKLQAGTYRISPAMSVQDIVKKMVEGDVAKNLLTILPGKDLDQIKKAFLKEGYAQAAVDKAFDASQYRDHPALASLPGGGSLEGYLYPDSFQKLVDTPPELIIRESLDEMQAHLTPGIINGFKAQDLSIFQGITLASIVEREVPHDTDRPTVAQIFLTRLKAGIRLESDATTSYFNTYNNPGLPPQPISNVTASALTAVAQPATTDYLFFVSGDDGTTHFSKTKQEHDTAVAKYCKVKCRH